MTDHADTIRRDPAESLALLIENLRRGWAPSGKSMEVYVADFEALLTERQQAIDERDAVMAAGRELERQRDHATEVTALLRARCEQAIEAIDERDAYHEQRDEWAERVGVLQRERDNWHASNYAERQARLTAEARCEQAIDALRTTEEWAYELGHDELAQRLSAALLNLGEQP